MAVKLAANVKCFRAALENNGFYVRSMIVALCKIELQGVLLMRFRCIEFMKRISYR